MCVCYVQLLGAAQVLLSLSFCALFAPGGVGGGEAMSAAVGYAAVRGLMAGGAIEGVHIYMCVCCVKSESVWGWYEVMTVCVCVWG